MKITGIFTILILLGTALAQDNQQCEDRTPKSLGARFKRRGTNCCTYAEVKCYITDESYYVEGHDMRDLLRCNRNIRVDSETTKNGTDYPKVEVRLEYKMCNWNENPNYKILLHEDIARFREWHSKTDTITSRSERTIYHKTWKNKVLDSNECITVVQNTLIDTSLGGHNLDSLIQGNAVIDGEVIIAGSNGDEFCFAYAFERIIFDEGECDVDTTLSCRVMEGDIVTDTECQTKVDAECPSNPELTFDAQFEWTACNFEDRIINLALNSNYMFDGKKDFLEELPANTCTTFKQLDTINCKEEKSWSMYIQGKSWQPGSTPFIDKDCTEYNFRKIFLPPDETMMPSTSPTVSNEPSVSVAPSLSHVPTNLPTETERPSMRPTLSQRPSKSHGPSLSSEPTLSLNPSESHMPSISVYPTSSQNPSDSHAPSTSLNPTVSKRPSSSPVPSRSLNPTETQKPSISNKPSTKLEPLTTLKPTQKPSIEATSPSPSNVKITLDPAPKSLSGTFESPSSVPSYFPSSVPSSRTPSKVPKSKGAAKAPASKGVSPSVPKDPKAKIDPKMKGNGDVASGVIAAAEGTVQSSTTSLKTLLSVLVMIVGGAIVF